MFALIASALIALASVFGSTPVSDPVEEFQPYSAPAEVNPFAGMTAAECGELPDYKSGQDCALALWDMDTLGLPTCATEDAANCYWLTTDGLSFIDIDGIAYYMPKMIYMTEA